MHILVDSKEINSVVDKFFATVLLTQLSKFLDPSESPWKDWLEILDANVSIPESQLDEVRNAWNVWNAGFQNRILPKKGNLSDVSHFLQQQG